MNDFEGVFITREKALSMLDGFVCSGVYGGEYLSAANRVIQRRETWNAGELLKAISDELGMKN